MSDSAELEQPATGAPARGYSWPPFQPGHTLSMRHGAKSARMVAPIAEQMASELSAAAPWTSGAQFAPTVAAWAWAEAQAQLVRQHLDEIGLLDEDGQPRGAANFLDRVEGRAAKLRAELGLTPASMVKLLGGLSSIDAGAAQGGLEALKAAGRQIRTAAELPAGSESPGVDDGAGGQLDPAAPVVGADPQLTGAAAGRAEGELVDGQVPADSVLVLAPGHGTDSPSAPEPEGGPDDR